MAFANEGHLALTSRGMNTQALGIDVALDCAGNIDASPTRQIRNLADNVLYTWIDHRCCTDLPCTLDTPWHQLGHNYPRATVARNNDRTQTNRADPGDKHGIIR
jgi:hypothetical protein